MGADPQAADSLLDTLMAVGPSLAAILMVGTFGLLLPWVVGILLSEAFAIRSWIFHALNGAASIGIGWYLAGEYQFRQQYYELFESSLPVVAAGIAAGFVYWVVAGWSAGFWRPVFKRSEPVRSQTPATLR
jgi:hypothetical protein